MVATDDSVYTGFGFEGVNAAARPELMKRVMAHLGVTGRAPDGAPGRRPAARRDAEARQGADHREAQAPRWTASGA